MTSDAPIAPAVPADAPRGSGTASGILLIDKPGGMTSHDVVSRVRRRAGTRKVGHAGTLDPMATGLLVLGVNSSTRLLTYVVGLDKEYVTTMFLGASTTTDDREGEVIETATAGQLEAVSDERIAGLVETLTGEIEQVPSSVSAIKVDGRRAYDLARAGEVVELASRRVTVSAFEVVEIRRSAIGLEIDARIECSSGTYIRALARDLGSALGVGGHLTALRRTRIGPFQVADSAELESLDMTASLRSPAAVAADLFPIVALDTTQTIDLSNGKRPRVDAPDGSPVAALAPDGRLVGLVEISAGTAKTLVNFPTDPGTLAGTTVEGGAR